MPRSLSDPEPAIVRDHRGACSKARRQRPPKQRQSRRRRPRRRSRQAQETDGFQLVIDALKLNGIDTIFGLPGIPITDLTRKLQAAGLRVISFRHEQNAGYAASIAGFLTQKPGICLTVSAPGLPQRPDRARQRHDQLLPDDPHQRLERARDRRPAAGRLRGDGPARDRQAARQGRVPRAARRGHRRRRRARDPRGACPAVPGGVYLDLPAKLFPQTIDAEAGKKSLIKVVDPAPRQIPAPDAVQARARSAQERQAAADHSRQGRGVRAGRRGHPRAGRKDRHSLSADVDGQGPAARHARAIRVRGALVRAARSRRRDADRRAPQLAAFARQGQDVGRQRAPRTGAARSSSRSTSRRRRRTATCASTRRSSATSARASRRCSPASDASWPKPPAEWLDAIAERKTKNVAKMAETLAKNPTPMNFHSALNVVRDIVKANPDAILVNEGANALDFTRSIVDMYKPRKRLDVGTWGIMGVGMGFSVAAAVVSGEQVIAIEGDSAFGFSGMEVRDDLPLQPAGVRRDHEQQRRLPRRRGQSDRRPRSVAAGVRQGRALREADGGLRRRGRAWPRRRPSCATRWKRRSARASRR